VPRIRDEILKSVAFIYETEVQAVANERMGGTGFLVAQADRTYLVTNQHVALDARRYVRVNATDGGADIVEIPHDGWESHYGGADLAATRLECGHQWDVTPLVLEDLYGSRDSFEARLAELNFGVGDDVVMAGRFVGYDGRDRNRPTPRFGNVSMMPGDTVTDGRGDNVEAFLVEMRSLPGFSGSPVFGYIAPGADRANGTMMPFFESTWCLLGIDTGHAQIRGGVYERGTNDLVDDSWEIRENAGVAIVAPVWNLEELFAQEDLAGADDVSEVVRHVEPAGQ
jgi:hypothetical protein